ncbi:MAG: hypothetical protein WB579_12955 [Bryobacteraceae bacterium]
MQIAERPDSRKQNPFQLKPLFPLKRRREEQATTSDKDNDAVHVQKDPPIQRSFENAVTQAIVE